MLLCVEYLIKDVTAGSSWLTNLCRKNAWLTVLENKIYKVSRSIEGRFNLSKMSSSDSEEDTWDTCVSWTWCNGMNLRASMLDLKFWKFDFIDIQVEAILEDCPLPMLWFLLISTEETLEVTKFDLTSFLVDWSALNASYFLAIVSLLLLSRPSVLRNSE